MAKKMLLEEREAQPKDEGDTWSGNGKPCMKKTSSAVLGRTVKRKSATAGIFLDESHTWKARDRSCKSEATRKKASRFWVRLCFYNSEEHDTKRTCFR